MKIKLTRANVTVFLMCLLVFLNMEPYFVWGHISPIGYKLYTGIIFVTTLAMALISVTKRLVMGRPQELTRQNKIPLALVLTSAGFVLLILYQIFLSGAVTRSAQPFNMAMVLIHIGLMLFCLQDHISLQKVFLVTKKIFAATLIPAIIIYILTNIGVPLFSVSLSADAGKELTGQSYELYMGVAVMLKSSGGELPRLCGLFREPGFVGTVGALYLLGDKFNLKKWENLSIFIACICTFSVAFYVLLICGLLLKIVMAATTPKKLVSGILATVLLVSAYLVFINVPLAPSSPFAELQQRLTLTEDGLAGDNRMTDEYAIAAYESWANSDTKTILLGYGEDTRRIPGTQISIWQKAHSIKEYIFTYGILSLVIMVATFVFSTLVKYSGVKGMPKRYILVLLAVFIFSIYQRYSVCTFFYLCLLFGGASNLALSGNGPQKESDEE